MVNLITDNIDIWTSAHTQKTNGSGRGNGSANKSLYGIKKLRELILELAVRGKMVPQDPNDEPASVLLEKIAKEKMRLFKEGKIKKQEPLPEIGEDEKTFELPSGWEWVRLAEVTEFVNGFAFKSSDFSDTGVGIVKIGDIQNGEITTVAMSRVEKSIVAGLDASLQVNKGDILIAMSGATTGKLGFNRTNEVFYINQRVGKIVPYFLHVEYLYYPLTTKIAENLAKSMGSAIPNLSTAQIKDIVFALPPLAEQHRLVAKVDELMALCDRLEQQQTDSNAAHQTLVETLLAALTSAANPNEFVEAWERVAEHFDTLFTSEYSVDQLKQTILQLAVMGKLVPQDPKDEPASILMERITKEKARLLKEGKVKKQEALPKISDNEKPYKLPEGWKFVRFGDATYNRDAERIPLSVDERRGRQGDYDYYGASGIIDSIDEYLFDKPLLLIGEDGANLINRSTPIAFIARGKYWVNNHAHVIDGLEEQLLFYLCLHINAISLKPYVTGTAQPKMNQSKMNSIILALPPLAEQRRIVAKVDELMAICDKLKSKLSEAQTIQIQLGDALVEQAVGGEKRV